MADKGFKRTGSEAVKRVQAMLGSFDVSIEGVSEGGYSVDVLGQNASCVGVSLEDGCLTLTQKTLEAGSGRISVRLKADSCELIDIVSVSGDIKLKRTGAGEVTLNSTSGFISANQVKAEGSFRAESASGGFDGSDISATDICLNMRSNAIKLSGAEASNEITVDSGSGDVSLSDVRALELKLESASGSVKINSCEFKHSFFIRTYAGDAEVKLMSATGLIKSTSGNIRFAGGSRELIIESTSGSIRALGEFERVRISSVSGGIGITSKLPSAERISVRTVSGDIDVWCPEQALHRVFAQSLSGSVRKH